jgi:seryl-tRNA synthetase
LGDNHLQSTTNAFNNLFNLWQDVCYPGLDRPFKLVKYVSVNRIIIADTRQGSAEQIVSVDMLQSAIERRKLENRLDAIRSETATATKQMKQTADASVRKRLSGKLNELSTEAEEVKKQIDDIGS